MIHPRRSTNIMSDKNKGTSKKQPKHSEPVTLAPLTFEEALRGLLETPPLPKPTKKRSPKKPKLSDTPNE